MTEKQIRFCEYYIQNGGNATKAAEDAGYSKRSAYTLGSRLLTKPEIIEYIKEHGVKEGLVADTNEILSFWTNIMRNNVDAQYLLSDRLKASENLAKAKGLFSERVILENSEDRSFDINIRVV